MTSTNEEARSTPYQGKGLGTRPFSVTHDLVAIYLGLTQGSTEVPISTIAPAIAPSMVLQEAEQLFVGNHFSNRFGELWVRQEWQFRSTVAAGDVLSVSARVADVYRRKNRTVVATEHAFSRGSQQVARSVHHNSFLLDQTLGVLDPKRPSAAVTPPGELDLGGEVIGGEVRRITIAQCHQFYGGAKNYHTDAGAAVEKGFDSIVIGGGMILAHVCEMMNRRFGDGWRNSGSLDLKFVNVLHPDEEFVVAGRIRRECEAPPSSHASVAVMCYRPASTTIAVGTASALA